MVRLYLGKKVIWSNTMKIMNNNIIYLKVKLVIKKQGAKAPCTKKEIY